MAGFDYIAQAVSPLISAASALSGVTLGGWLTNRNQKIERRQRFIREQLSEFYAPMLGYRARLKARGELRLKIHNVAGSEWARLVERTREMSHESMQELQRGSRPAVNCG